MSEIRIQEIDGQEFIPFKDYKRLLERNEEKMIKIRELEGENQKLKEEKQELEYLGDINEELKEENKKLKERFKKLDDQTPKLEKHLTLLYRLIKYWRGKYERYKKEMVPYLFCKTDCYPKFRPEDYGLVGKDGKLVLIEDVNF